MARENDLYYSLYANRCIEALKALRVRLLKEAEDMTVEISALDTAVEILSRTAVAPGQFWIAELEPRATYTAKGLSPVEIRTSLIRIDEVTKLTKKGRVSIKTPSREELPDNKRRRIELDLPNTIMFHELTARDGWQLYSSRDFLKLQLMERISHLEDLPNLALKKG